MATMKKSIEVECCDVIPTTNSQRLRLERSKSEQIKSMIRELVCEKGVITFYDDDPLNIHEVKTNLGCKCVLIDGEVGIKIKDLIHFTHIFGSY